MGHELSEIDGVVEMAYLESDGCPWHGLGQPISDENANNLEEWGKASNMANFTFETAPVLFFEEATDEVHSFDNKRVAFRSDNKKPIDIIGDRYKIVQPQEVLQFFEDVIGGMGYKMTSAGVLFGGRRFWAQATTGESRAIGGVDKVNNSILLATGFDGCTLGMETATRVVCNNTYTQAKANAADKVKITHAKAFNAGTMKDALGLDPANFAEWCDIADAMATVKISQEDSILFTAEAFGVLTPEIMEVENAEEQLAIAQSSSIVMACDKLFNGDGMGAELVTAKGTLWGTLNGISEFVDHHRKTRTVDARLEGAWFGKEARIKERAWENALLKTA